MKIHFFHVFQVFLNFFHIFRHFQPFKTHFLPHKPTYTSDPSLHSTPSASSTELSTTTTHKKRSPQRTTVSLVYKWAGVKLKNSAPRARPRKQKLPRLLSCLAWYQLQRLGKHVVKISISRRLKKVILVSRTRKTKIFTRGFGTFFGK